MSRRVPALSRRVARPITGLFVPKPRRRIIFQHVPKSGGSSVNAVFKGLFRGSRFGQSVLLTDHALSNPQLIEYARGARFVGGHFGPRIRSAVRDDGYVFTVLRDPVERIISHWRFLQSHRRLELHLPYDTLEEALSSGSEPVRYAFDNVFARQYGAGHELTEAAKVPRKIWVDKALDALRAMDRVIDLSDLNAGVDAVLDDCGLTRRRPIEVRNRTDGEGRRNLAKGVVPPKVDARSIEGVVAPYVELDRQLMQAWTRKG